MKKLIVAIIIIASSIGANAQNSKSVVKTTFEVNGNCEMCKSTIEKSAKKAGATKAIWNVDSHILSVEFKQNKTNLKKIQEAIAVSGYDNVGAESTQSAYDKLHGCCKYDRKKMEENAAKN